MSYGAGSERRFFKPIIQPAAKSPVGLSFINLVEAHVLGAIRRRHRVDMPAVRRAVDFLKHELGSAHPLADHEFETNGVDLFISHYGHFISVSQGGQIAVREVLEAHLKRIDRDRHGIPIRLYPFIRSVSPEEPRNIVIDPFISFGKAVIAGTGVSTAIFSREDENHRPNHPVPPGHLLGPLIVWLVKRGDSPEIGPRARPRSVTRARKE